MAISRWSLTTRVLTATVALLSLLLMVVALTHERATSERRDAEIALAIDAGNAVAGMIDEFGRNVETTLLATSFAVVDGRTVTQANTGPTLAAVSRQVGLARGPFIFVTDENGRVLASANGGSIGVDLSARPYMRSLMGGAPTVWGPTVSGVVSGGTTLTYGQALRATDGSPRGYLVMAFYPSDLATRFQDRIPSDSNVTIIDASGFALYSSQHPDLPAEKRALAARTEVQAALRGETVRIESAPGLFDDAPRFGVVVPVGGTGWAVAFTRPLAPLNAVLQRQLATQVGVVSAAVVTVGILMAVATRRIARPLRELAATAEAVARGDWTVGTPRGGGREITDLGTAMGLMSSAVAEREEALQRELARREILAETAASFAAAGLDPEEELETVARLVSQHVGEGCNVFLLSADGKRLQPAAVYHPAPGLQATMAGGLAMEPVLVGESLSGRVAKSGTAIVLTDVIEESQALVNAARLAHFRDVGMHAFAAVPIAARGRTIGVLCAWRTTAQPYSADEVSLLQAIADDAGVHIENAQLIEDVRAHAATAEQAVHEREQFAAQVAHDILNPLAAIKAVAQLNLRRLSRQAPVDAARLESDMRAVEDAATRAANQVGTSLEVARGRAEGIPALALASTDLIELVGEVIELTRRLSTQHRIIMESPQTLIVGEWDRGQLVRAIENILANAVKYSPAGGTVTVLLGTAEREGVESAVIEVRDEGIGIPEPALPHVFDRFYRAENTGDIAGTGLGLSGVQDIVVAHGGSVHVESVEGQGSVFRICLPLAPSIILQ